MKFDLVVKFLPLAIAIYLSAIAVHLYVPPPAVEALSGSAHSLYFEPGTFTLRAPDASRSVLGKLAIDLRNGNIGGFPTLQTDPYPAPRVDTSSRLTSFPGRQVRPGRYGQAIGSTHGISLVTNSPAYAYKH
jgi:hypothetical protein